MEEQAPYGVHCTHIHETLNFVTNIGGFLLYRNLSNLNEIFTANGQNSVEASIKIMALAAPAFHQTRNPSTTLCYDVHLI
jgi:hypothetical protein